MSRIPALGPRGEGWVVLQLGTLALIVVADSTGPSIPIADRVPTLTAGVGWLVLAGAAIVIVASLYLLARARALTALPRPMDSGGLVTSGPYRFVRHPVYAGLILGSIGLALVRLSITTLVLALVLFVVLDVKRRREEDWLSERYPDYGAYRSRTHALVPFVY